MFVHVFENGCVHTPTWCSLCGSIHSKKKHEHKAFGWYKQDTTINSLKEKNVCFVYMSGTKRNGGGRWRESHWNPFIISIVSPRQHWNEIEGKWRLFSYLHIYLYMYLYMFSPTYQLFYSFKRDLSNISDVAIALPRYQIDSKSLCQIFLTQTMCSTQH